ncbi:MAG: hypothetical protein JW910_14715, partial [Anaerolineae bacterium]|nr:hypothetical protein [Anaerolineae bacterium]
MDIWGVLALIFAGAFFGTLILALFYWREIRPRLLALTPPAPADAPNGEQYEELHHALRVLNDAMVRHSALMAQLPTSFEVSTPAVLEADALAERLLAIEAAQTRTVNALGDLHNAVTREGANALRAVQGVDAAQQPQRAVLARLEDEIAALKAAQAPFEDALVWLQAEFVKLQGT